jgi:hypothetical protein
MKEEFSRQYKSALGMIDEFIDKCPDDFWLDEKYQSPAWQVCYHALFYTNIYLSPSEVAILKWEGERDEYHDLRRIGREKDPAPLEPYSRREMKTFQEHIRSRVPSCLEDMEPDRDCWPFWYNQNQLEFHMNNLRHLQHHTGELFERLNIISPVPYQWR